jgi:hypothetical protein
MSDYQKSSTTRNGDRFMFHEKVLKDHHNLSTRAIVLAGYIMHLRRAQHGGKFRVSTSDAAKYLRVHRRTAIRALSELERRGHLTRLDAPNAPNPRFAFGATVTPSGTVTVTAAVTHNRPEESEENHTGKNLCDFRQSRKPRTRRTKETWKPSKANAAFAYECHQHGDDLDRLVEHFKNFAMAYGISVRNWNKCWQSFVVKDAELNEQSAKPILRVVS